MKIDQYDTKFIVTAISIFGIILLSMIFLFLRNKPAAEITDIVVTNITANSATITWTSSKPIEGKILWGTENNWIPFLEDIGKDKEYDDRDIINIDNKKRITHHVTIDNLDPNKEYFFGIENGGQIVRTENNHFKTLSSTPDLSVPNVAYSFIDAPLSVSQDTIVRYKLSGQEDRHFSTVVSKDLGWIIDLSQLKQYSDLTEDKSENLDVTILSPIGSIEDRLELKEGELETISLLSDNNSAIAQSDQNDINLTQANTIENCETWSCETDSVSECASEETVELFENTWCDGESQWKWEAAGGNSDCGGQESGLTRYGCETGSPIWTCELDNVIPNPQADQKTVSQFEDVYCSPEDQWRLEAAIANDKQNNECGGSRSRLIRNGCGDNLTEMDIVSQCGDPTQICSQYRPSCGVEQSDIEAVYDPDNFLLNCNMELNGEIQSYSLSYYFDENEECQFSTRAQTLETLFCQNRRELCNATCPNIGDINYPDNFFDYSATEGPFGPVTDYNYLHQDEVDFGCIYDNGEGSLTSVIHHYSLSDDSDSCYELTYQDHLASARGEAAGEELELNNNNINLVSAQVSTFDRLLIDDPGRYRIRIDSNREATLNIFKNGSISIFDDENGDNIKQSSESINTNELNDINVSKIAELSKVDLNSGWNSVSFDIVPQEWNTASEFIENSQDFGIVITDIAYIEPGTNKWKVYKKQVDQDGVVKTVGEDFKISTTQGLFIKTIGNGDLYYTGTNPSSNEFSNLANGWNLISLNNLEEDTTAEGLFKLLSNEGIDASQVVRYKNQNFEPLIKEDDTFFGVDFSLNKREGYFVKVDAIN
jgi:hypothetical protein